MVAFTSVSSLLLALATVTLVVLVTPSHAAGSLSTKQILSKEVLQANANADASAESVFFTNDLDTNDVDETDDEELEGDLEADKKVIECIEGQMCCPNSKLQACFTCTDDCPKPCSEKSPFCSSKGQLSPWSTNWRKLTKKSVVLIHGVMGCRLIGEFNEDFRCSDGKSFSKGRKRTLWVDAFTKKKACALEALSPNMTPDGAVPNPAVTVKPRDGFGSKKSSGDLLYLFIARFISREGVYLKHMLKAFQRAGLDMKKQIHVANYDWRFPDSDVVQHKDYYTYLFELLDIQEQPSMIMAHSNGNLMFLRFVKLVETAELPWIQELLKKSKLTQVQEKANSNQHKDAAKIWLKNRIDRHLAVAAPFLGSMATLGHLFPGSSMLESRGVTRKTLRTMARRVGTVLNLFPRALPTGVNDAPWKELTDKSGVLIGSTFYGMNNITEALKKAGCSDQWLSAHAKHMGVDHSIGMAPPRAATEGWYATVVYPSLCMKTNYRLNYKSEADLDAVVPEFVEDVIGDGTVPTASATYALRWPHASGTGTVQKITLTGDQVITLARDQTTGNYPGIYERVVPGCGLGDTCFSKACDHQTIVTYNEEFIREVLSQSAFQK